MLALRLSILAVVTIAVVAGSAGAGHESPPGKRSFSTIVFPKGTSYDGAFISGKCVAVVNVETEYVELSNCSFAAR